MAIDISELDDFYQFAQQKLGGHEADSLEDALRAFRNTHSGPLVTAGEWTDRKNSRRCELIDREIAGIITSNERAELDDLQSQLFALQDKVAPLPIEELRQLEKRLLRKATEAVE